MAGKFGGNLIWRIGLQFHLADFNLAVLFLQAMMSYIIVMRRNVTRMLHLVQTCSIEVSKWKYGGWAVYRKLNFPGQKLWEMSDCLCGSMFSGKLSNLCSFFWRIFVVLAAPRGILFLHTLHFYVRFLDLFVWKRGDFHRVCQALSGRVPVQRHLQS